MVQSAAVVSGTNATAAQYNGLRNDVLLGLKNIQSDTDAATVTMDMSASNDHTVTLGGNRTIAFSNVSTGQWFYVELVQDATGSRTVTWPAGIKWPDRTAPVLSLSANSIDAFMFQCVGSNSYRGYFAGFDIG